MNKEQHDDWNPREALIDEMRERCRLRSAPSLIPAAVEEILRADGPLVANRRTTTREVEIQGRTIPEGQSLSPMWIATNRDPRAFVGPSAVTIERSTDGFNTAQI